jgi:hypothetical protein
MKSSGEFLIWQKILKCKLNLQFKKNEGCTRKQGLPDNRTNLKVIPINFYTAGEWLTKLKVMKKNSF